MKYSIRHSILAPLYIVSITQAFAADWVGIGLQNSKNLLQQHRVELEGEGHSVSILNDYTGKFENDNTSVHLYNPAYNTDGVKVTYKDVFISIPPSLNADSLIEALIKVRAARTFGANQIVLRSDQPLRNISIEHPLGRELNLDTLFSVAGADSVSERKKTRSLGKGDDIRQETKQPDYWIGESNSSDLIHQVAEQLNKSPVTFSNLQKDPSLLLGRRIYWFAEFTAPVNENFVTTLAHIQWMKKQGAIVHLVSPYLIYARSDKPEFHIGATTQGRLMADLIEAVGTRGITVVRAHAPQSLGFFKIHSNEISARSTLVSFLKSQQIECIISPDAGFQKDATKYQSDLTEAYGGEKPICLVVMNKERNSDGKERLLGGTGIENIRNKSVVIIDDETSSGGTLSQVAQLLQGYQPKSIFAAVTHLAGPAQKALNSENIQKLIATNSVRVKFTHPKLTVLSIAKEIANEISHKENSR